MNKSYKARFTLLELLIVIGIIAILSTLILGVLQRGNASSRRINSIQNFKSIIQGVMTATNHDSGSSFRGIFTDNISTTGLEKRADQRNHTTTLNFNGGAFPASVKVNDYYITPSGEDSDAFESGNVLSVFAELHGAHPFDSETGFYGFRGSFSENSAQSNKSKMKIHANTRILGEGYHSEYGDGNASIGFGDGHVETVIGLQAIEGEFEADLSPVKFVDSYYFELNENGKLLLDGKSKWMDDSDDTLEPRNSSPPQY